MKRVEITLKNDKLKSYYLISWLIVLLNFVIQLYLTFNEKYKHDRFLVFSLLFLIFLFLVIGRGNKFNSKDKKRFTGIIYIVICAIWIYWHLYWAAALNLLFDLLFIFSTRKFEIIFSLTDIIYPSFPKRKILWNELSNVLIKDGLLTLDFKNNKLVQMETEGDDFFDEKEFNDFCQKQLSSASSPLTHLT